MNRHLAICILLCGALFGGCFPCGTLPGVFGEGMFAQAALAQGAAASRSSSQLEQTLVAAEKSFIEAAKKGDVGFFQRTLTEDFSYVGADGQVADRQQMIDERSDSGYDILAYNMKVLPVSEGVGIVTYDVVLRVSATEDEGPPPRYQHFSTVWVKQGDAWKMKFQQMSVAHWGDW